ncbi:MAG: SDR family oxidoreductase [Solirubrobacterales bacterium]|nr:SDR family oxidoreductase [Solirubrobacterales bacterium]MCB8971486.1 SDR family oxidoreductase [Thermoleophilales bacterium]MCO5327101.1 SDR family oxidoreductase [Solirubrobacterales bacterium]
MDLGIEGRVALVMGASKGIGRGIASALAAEGARLAVSSRSEENLAALVADLGSEQAAAYPADTGDLVRIRELPGEIERDLGPIEILVLNTGGPPRGGSLEHSTDAWEDAYQSLVLTPRILAEAVVPGMRERGWGRIVNVASSSIREPIPDLALSNSTRMAAVGFLNTLAREVAGDGITVNTIATGRFATERLAEGYGGSLDEAARVARDEVPAARLGTPEEFGDLVAFVCSERAAYLTGTVIPLDGGLTRSS